MNNGANHRHRSRSPMHHIESKPKQYGVLDHCPGHHGQFVVGGIHKGHTPHTGHLH
jgi:hypothetical protein